MNVYVSFFLKSSPKGRSHSLMMPNVFFAKKNRLEIEWLYWGLVNVYFSHHPTGLGI